MGRTLQRDSKQKHKNKAAALRHTTESNEHTEWGNGNTGTNKARSPAGHTAVNKAAGIDGIISRTLQACRRSNT
jgi:hypothetical protein